MLLVVPVRRFRGVPFWLAKASERAHDVDVVRWLYLRALGAVLFIAFVSFWVQAEGLVGDRGIIPVAEHLPSLAKRLGVEAYWRMPSLLWLWPSGMGVHVLCFVGTTASAVLAFGRAPGPSLLVAWVAWLSMFYGAQRWLGFQWDLLLVETCFLSLFISPWRRRPRQVHDEAAPRYLVWLHRWLLARLMLSSGLGKLFSNDGTWTELTALDYHFWTQPLPNLLSWHAHHAGHGIHAVLVVVTLVAQVGAPVLLFCGRRARLVGGGMIVASQIGIAATGNFAYFNLLTLALCLLALDDEALRRLPLLRRWALLKDAPLIDERPPLRGREAVGRAAAVLVGFLSVVQFAQTLGADRALPRFVVEGAEMFRPLRLVSGYGLFTRMTMSRPEVEIEGSQDGRTWSAYRFPYKVGPLDQVPLQVAPHQPRLDWQLWFAALGDARRNPWVVRTLQRILDNEPSVMALLEVDPFDGLPPKYIRAFRYEYRFTTPEERARTGHWWAREPVGPYTGVLTRPGP